MNESIQILKMVFNDAIQDENDTSFTFKTVHFNVRIDLISETEFKYNFEQTVPDELLKQLSPMQTVMEFIQTIQYFEEQYEQQARVVEKVEQIPEKQAPIVEQVQEEVHLSSQV